MDQQGQLEHKVKEALLGKLEKRDHRVTKDVLDLLVCLD